MPIRRPSSIKRQVKKAHRLGMSYDEWQASNFYEKYLPAIDVPASYIAQNRVLYAEFIERLHFWGEKVRQQLIQNVNRLETKGKAHLRTRHAKDQDPFADNSKINYEQKLANDIQFNLKQDQNGEITALGFSFPKHGVFWAKGAGPGTRKPMDWFNTIINNNTPELHSIVAEFYADLTVNTMAVFIR